MVDDSVGRVFPVECVSSHDLVDPGSRAVPVWKGIWLDDAVTLEDDSIDSVDSLPCPPTDR